MKKAVALLLSLVLILSLAGCATVTRTIIKRPLEKNDPPTVSEPTAGPTVAPTEPSRPAQEPSVPEIPAKPAAPSGDAAGDKAQQTVDLVMKNTVPYNGYIRDESGYTVYYVDSENGNDQNDGLSPQRAWRSLTKVNVNRFAPGTKVLLKRGCVFDEPLAPISSGEPGKYFIIDAYGTGTQKPLIQGGGESSAVSLSNLQYVEVRNLEITNTSEFMANRFGVSVRSGGYLSSSVLREGGMVHHVYLIDLDIHDVTCRDGSRFYGGIVFYSSLSKNPAAFTDVLVQGCTIRNTGGAGIVMASDYEHGPGVGWSVGTYYPSQNVTFRGNYIAHCASDGIFQSAANNVLMEYNTVVDTSYAQGAYAGMWPHYSSNVVMQYNEVYDTKLVGGDGQGFDVDIDCVNTVVQYNYSHDNEGGFILLCTDGSDNGYNKDITVRYNISQNDRGQIFTLSGPISDVKIYNNTVYVAEGSTNLVGSYDWGAGKSPAAVRFSNNLFYLNTTGRSSLLIPSRIVFDTNLFYGSYDYSNLPAVNTVTADPQLSAPGKGAIGMDTLAGYRLKSGSPCIDAGLTLASNGGKDFFGTAVPSAGQADIGAAEFVH